MDVLLAMRGITLVAWFALAASLLRIVWGRGRHLPTAWRGAWAVVAGKHVTIALTTAMVETTWLMTAINPYSRLSALGRALYNPTYLLNATVAAIVPFFVTILMIGPGRGRLMCGVGATTVLLLAIIAVASGATEEWTTLMSWTQVLAFAEIGGYLAFWGGVLLGRISRVDPYMLGLLGVATLFTLLLPVQFEFFEFVGWMDAFRIWHLHEFLQLALVAAELVIVLAYLNRLRSALDSRPESTVALVGTDL